MHYYLSQVCMYVCTCERVCIQAKDGFPCPCVELEKCKALNDNIGNLYYVIETVDDIMIKMVKKMW